MRVLVTGVTGFLGNYVVNKLLEGGNEVIATSRSKEKAKGFSWFNKVEFIEFDLNHSGQFDANLFLYFKSPDKLIHLGWENLPNYHELFHFERNLFSSYYFIKKLINEGLKDITVTGTCLEYGMQTGCLVETLPSNPGNPYAIAKDTLRRLIEVMQWKEKFVFKWIRLFYLYGKGQSQNSLYSQLEKTIANDEMEFKMSEGKQIRDFLPVKDAINNIVKLSLSNESLGIVNCCSGKPQTVKSFVENYFTKHKKEIKLVPGYYPYPDYEPFEFWGNTNKLNSITKEYVK